jgi:Na+/H+ antiporter NhaD/arsenite permease-like protein
MRRNACRPLIAQSCSHGAILLERARGSRRRLFVLLFLAGGVLTLVLSNDATAIVLTPIVYRAIAKRGGDAMPFLFGCTFVADTTSFGLPFANPANVLILPHARLIPYLLHLGPPQIVAVALNLALFLVVFRSQLRGRSCFMKPGIRRGEPRSGAPYRRSCGSIPLSRSRCIPERGGVRLWRYVGPT